MVPAEGRAREMTGDTPKAGLEAVNRQAAEMDARRGASLDDVPGHHRDMLRETLKSLLTHRWPITEIHEIYVTGSWCRGEAIRGISDLDIVVVVDPDTLDGPVSGVREWFKSEWSTVFSLDWYLFIDLWVEAGPPKNRVKL